MSTPAMPPKTPRRKIGKGTRTDPEHEVVLLADVDIHRYTSLVGDPGEGYTDEAAAQLDVEQIIDRNYWISKGASKQLGDLVATGFIAPSDLAMLDTTAEEAKQIEDRHGKEALRSLTTVGTPRRARLKSELYRQKRKTEEAAAAAAAGGTATAALAPVEERIINEETRLEDLTPSVAIYYMFMQKAAERRAQARKRRRVMVSLNKQNEIKEHLALMRGTEPLRKPRKFAISGERTQDDEPIKEGQIYIENGILTTYFFDPNTNLWHKLVGPPQNVFKDPHQDAEVPDPRILDEYTRFVDLEDEHEPNNQLLWCRDSTGELCLNIHGQWFNYWFPTEKNFPFCQGLCRYSEGWAAPEGIDGVEPLLSLVYDSNSEPIATHHVCKSCGIRLCAKCYKLVIDEHHGCVWELVRMYADWRISTFVPWSRKLLVPVTVPGVSEPAPMPRPQSYRDWVKQRRAAADYDEPTDPEGTIHFDPQVHGRRLRRPAKTGTGDSSGVVEAGGTSGAEGEGGPPPSGDEGKGGGGKNVSSGGAGGVPETPPAASSTPTRKWFFDGFLRRSQNVIQFDDDPEVDYQTYYKDMLSRESPSKIPATVIPTEKKKKKKENKSTKPKKNSKTAPNTVERKKVKSVKKGKGNGKSKIGPPVDVDPTRPLMTLGPFGAVTPSEVDTGNEMLEDVDLNALIEADQEQRMWMEEKIQRERERQGKRQDEDEDEDLDMMTPQRPSPVLSEHRRVTRSVSRRLASEEL